MLELIVYLELIDTKVVFIFIFYCYNCFDLFLGVETKKHLNYRPIHFTKSRSKEKRHQTPPIHL